MAFKVKLVKELEIEIDSKLYNVREPSLDELASYADSIKGKEQDQAHLIKSARDFVGSLGFPSEFHSKMSWYGLRDLIEYLAGEKKS
jgi:hypothetical protein